MSKTGCKRKQKSLWLATVTSGRSPACPYPYLGLYLKNMTWRDEPGGSIKTIGLRGSCRITRIISISMLDWRSVRLRSPKYVVIPKDTHAGAKRSEQAGGSRTGGLARLEKQEPARLEG
ncbi:hypothetical protein E5676_scaffold808G00160 [Cucumis melo var. makuwa]|uniref:Uncharacterized protein n=1 Tax=Cucumis melo var. makuwa TaxID=1194695 RepID=A0A5D3BSE8_CUCMM|nr:hypothetical protein E5676_scaffold808G00160 [Cucumis melo var. makuwa]